MRKRLLIMLILAGVVFGGIFAYKAYRGRELAKMMSSRGVPPQTVSTIVAKKQPWQMKLEAVGSLHAFQGTDIAPEVGGIVTRILFRSGEDVQEGALLLQLNAAPEIAKLHSLEATAELAKTVLARDEKQFQEQAISAATIDADTANLKSAQAQVNQQQALVDLKSIRAPFAGRLGIRAVSLGQYLNAGTPIVALQALDPIYNDFYLPQKSIGQIAVGQKATVRTDAVPGRTFTAEITALESQVDPTTRNIRVRAVIQNPAHILLPGMFAVTEILTGRPQELVTLPQTAVTYNPYGNLVYLVEKESAAPGRPPQPVARQKFVTTGEKRGDQVAILEGVRPGDVVVTTGQLKLRNGTPVVVNNAIEPANAPAPQPQDQ